MNDDGSIPYVVTRAAKTQAAIDTCAIEEHRRQRNAIEERQRAAKLAGEAARKFGLTVEPTR